MRFPTRILFSGLLFACLHAVAADYPTRPIRLVVPFSPGGNVDITARVISGRLGEVLGQTVVVDNRPGGGGSIGATAVAKSPADGYTLLMGASGPLSINPIAMPKLPYDPLKDFAAISSVHTVPLVVLARSKDDVASIAKLIERAKAQPDRLTAGSAGIGSMNHLAIALFDIMAGVKLVHVPYKGGAPALSGLLGGEATTVFDQLNSSIGFIKDGRVIPLAITGLKRSPILPQVPTLDELGLKGYEAVSFVGMLAPAGTPKAIVDRLNKAVRETLETPAVLQKLRELGTEPAANSPDEFAQLIKSELDKWSNVAKRAGVNFE